MGAFSDGLNTKSTDYTSTLEADYAFTGRVEYKWDGDWKQYDEFTAFRDAKYFGAIGGALHYQWGGHTVGTTRSATVALS